MLKKYTLALTVLLGLTAPALAEPTLHCEPPVLHVPSDPASRVAQYTVACRGADASALTPALQFSGEVAARGTAPYPVKATYTLDVRSMYAQTLSVSPLANQVMTGTLESSTVSVAALPVQFAAQAHWDAQSGVMSIQERPGQWRAFSLGYDEQTGDSFLQDAGVVAHPVVAGRVTTKLLLGEAYSRFAGKTAAVLPMVTAELALREGKLELLVGQSRVASQAGLQAALMHLDKRPGDMARAWAFAAQAKFLDLPDEVRYAEQKVAAHNPQLLQEFQLNLQRIQPYVLPQP